MALTFVQNINTLVAAYADNVVKLQTSDTSNDVIGVRVLFTIGTKQVETYAPIFNRRAEFNFKTIYPTLLNDYFNLIKESNDAGTIKTMPNDTLVVTESYMEVYVNGTYGTPVNTTRYLLRSITDFGNTEWDVSKGIFILDNKPKYVLPNDIISISYINNYTSYTSMYYRVNDGAWIYLSQLPNKRYINTFTIGANQFIAGNKITFSGSTLYGKLDYFIDTNKYARTKTLYFLNNMGGWEQINFLDYDKIINVDKNVFSRYSNSSFIKKSIIKESNTSYKLYVRQLNDEYLSILESLITSPLVIDELGNEVIVNDTNFTYDYSMNQVYISIENAESNKVIKY